MNRSGYGTIELPFLVVFAFAVFCAVLWFLNYSKKHDLTKLTETIEGNRGAISRLNADLETARAENKNTKNDLLDSSKRLSDLSNIMAEKNIHFPWLATAFADYQELIGKREERFVRYKKHPAPSSADAVKAATARTKMAERNFRLLKYRLDFLEKFFPWIPEVAGDTLENILARNDKIKSDDGKPEDVKDPVNQFISPEEYRALSPSRRNQLALDRWMSNRNKPIWEIGRIYERFVGYKYEVGVL